MKAKAAVFQGTNKPFSINEYEVTPPQSGYALVELIASGVCGTDIHIHGGKIGVQPPMIIGHEFVGKVREIAQSDANSSGIAIGDNVIVSVAQPCGRCVLCGEGDDANCVNMGVTYFKSPEEAPHFFGGFAECTYAPVGNMIKLPSEIEPVSASVFACAAPTALHAFRLAAEANVKVAAANVAVVQGLGSVGLFAVIYLASIGVKNIIAITTGGNPERDGLALELGATSILSLGSMSADECIAAVRSASGGLGADIVFEASGNPQAFNQGVAMLRNRGAYLVPGQYSNSGTIPFSPQLVTFNALHIIGSSQYSLTDVQAYIAFLQKNPQILPQLAKMYTAYPLAEINQAFDHAKSGKNIKTIITAE